MICGTVKSFCREPEGYGFARVPGEARDVFLHAQDLIGRARESLNVGDVIVINHIVEHGNNPRALGVRLADDVDPAPKGGPSSSRSFAPDEGAVWRAP